MNVPHAILASSPLPEGAEGGSLFEHLFQHVIPHPFEVGGHQLELFGLPVWNLQIFQLISVGLSLLVFLGVARAIRSGGGGRFAVAMAGFASFIREEMVHPYLGKEDGDRFLPFFLGMFFFLFFQNACGMIPGWASPTASVYVPAAMALVTFAVMLGGGMLVQGPLRFWLNLVPHGVPVLLWPLMLLVELIGLCVKPFALTVRLTANMLGGHLVLLSFLGLMLYFGSEISVGAGAAFAPVSIGLSVFITIIEGFVALLQAYIFTLLSIVFVGMCLHPDH